MIGPTLSRYHATVGPGAARKGGVSRDGHTILGHDLAVTVLPPDGVQGPGHQEHQRANWKG